MRFPLAEKTAFEIAGEIRRCQADPMIDGVVVVQGTDVIEETAFLWDLVLVGDYGSIVLYRNLLWRGAG